MTETNLQKNQIIRLSCERLGADLEGVCRHHGLTVFVPGVLPGETFDAKVLKVQTSYAFAKIERLLMPSPDRREPFCPVYELCGGCSGQHMTYALTLDAKRQQVYDGLTRIGGLSLTQSDVPPVIGAENPARCRNKASLPASGSAQSPALGFYRRRSHDLVDIADCPVTLHSLTGVIASVKQWMREHGVAPYDELTHQGFLRHVVVRANRGGDTLAVLVATADTLPAKDALVSLLQKNAPGFQGLHISENKSKGNVILGDTSRKLHGADTISETLLGLTFEITPLSFFQVNPGQAEALYQKAIEFANLSSGDLVVDAYAGAGTISLCMAKHCRQVIGLEIVPQAVESAKRNAQINGIANAEFLTAAVEIELPRLLSGGLRPDVVVLDPPRKGVEQPVIDALLSSKSRRIVYVSCHVPTQARDIQKLTDGGYRFIACQPVDMFCYAGGVENVVCLEI
ncbi:MAG: 23S rRNA (uracil(1939)-C(5))-methyltransferase RlmD [Bacillota bacterium]